MIMRLLPAVALVALTVTGCSAPVPQTFEVGQCLMISDVTEVVDVIPTVDCAQPHEAEVFAVVEPVDYGEPGDGAIYDAEAVTALAESECVEDFEAYVGEPYRTSRLDIYYTYPLEKAWAQGPREVMCAAWVPDEDTQRPVAFEGSLAG